MAAFSGTGHHVLDASSAPVATRTAALPLVPRVVPRHDAGHLQHSAGAPSGPAGSHLVLAVARPAADGQYETLTLNAGEPIRDLTMKLRNNGWFSSKSCIVFGDRELADAVRTSDLVTASGKANAAYLHVFVKLADVESVTMRTLMRELSLASPASAEQQLASMMAAAASGSKLLALPSSSPEQQAQAASSSGSSSGVPEAAGAAAAAAAPDADSSSSGSAAQDAFDSAAADRGCHGKAVVHLCIHKSAKVNWRSSGSGDQRFELSISSNETVESLMAKIEAANGMALEPPAALLTDSSTPLAAAGQPLASYGISKGATKLELLPHEPEVADADALPDGSPSLASPLHGLHEHWQAARAGLAEGLAPTLSKAGTGGSYFLQDTQGRPVAVFKPQDEEPLAVNNPKGRVPGSSSDGSASSGSSSGAEGLRRGTKPGEGAAREVAAYVLDHGHFSGVPPTALVSMHVSDQAGGGVTMMKTGSLQQFVPSEGDCEERGFSGFPVSEVHKIAVLDLRLGNADRNAGNILARRGVGAASGEATWELVPIDHGYILPASFEDLSFEWAYWPQAEQPFSDAARSYIAALDAGRDIASLAAHGISLRPDCERTLRVCTMALQLGAAAGLSAAQIAGILCRDGLTKSVIERLHSNALSRAAGGPAAAAAGGGGGASPAYLAHMEALLKEYLAEYVLESADLLL